MAQAYDRSVFADERLHVLRQRDVMVDERGELVHRQPKLFPDHLVRILIFLKQSKAL